MLVSKSKSITPDSEPYVLALNLEELQVLASALSLYNASFDGQLSVEHGRVYSLYLTIQHLVSVDLKKNFEDGNKSL